MRQLLSSWPPSMVSAKWTSQLSCESTLPMPAAMPPSAITVCALPSSDFVTTETEHPASAAAIAARMPAPPAPMTSTSVSMGMYGSLISSEHDVRVREDPGAKQMDVGVGDHDAEHAQPRPDRVAPVEDRGQRPHPVAPLAQRRRRVAVQAAARQVTERVAPECVARQEKDVDQHDAGADAHLHVAGVRVEEREEDVVPEKAGDDEHQVEEEPVQVVEEERELRLPAIPPVAHLPHRAGRRIPEEGPVVALSVVVAGGPEQERRAEHPQRRAHRPGDPEQRRVERREVRAELVDTTAEEGGPDRVRAEAGEDDDDGDRVQPPWRCPVEAVAEAGPGTGVRRRERGGRGTVHGAQS